MYIYFEYCILQTTVIEICTIQLHLPDRTSETKFTVIDFQCALLKPLID